MSSAATTPVPTTTEAMTPEKITIIVQPERPIQTEVTRQKQAPRQKEVPQKKPYRQMKRKQRKNTKPPQIEFDY